METLTDKQTEILEAIRALIKLNGQSPTVREIGARVRLRSSCSVQKQIEALERAGKIKRSNFKYRSIEIVGEERTVREQASVCSIPILGLIAGGSAIEAMEDPDPELLTLPTSLLQRFDEIRQQEACDSGNYFQGPLFALKVVGDSMIEAGIDNGDLIVAKKQSTAENGEIVVAMVEDYRATVKKFYRENGRIRLQPANSSYEPIYPESLQILGKVALSIKRY
jgi:repressor LexA